MLTMRVVQVSRPGGDWEIAERPMPSPAAGHVRIKVDACGICHSDDMLKNGHYPGVHYPCVPGHEVAGRVDALGEGVTQWKVGQRVGVGWHGGHCFRCAPCRDGDFAMCENRKTTAIDFDGGYAEYIVAPAEAVAAIPDGLSSEEAAPLLCAGVTVFNALRNSRARPGDRVAVLGVGGLGHLGVQYARRMGFVTIAIARGKEREPLAQQLGAHYYIDSGANDPAKELKKLGGAHVVLATAPNSKAISALVDGMAPSGRLLVIAAAAEPLSVSTVSLIVSRSSVCGWYSGVAKDSEDTLNFSAVSGVRPMIECYPLAKVAEAYNRMITSKVRFRAVLTMAS